MNGRCATQSITDPSLDVIDCPAGNIPLQIAPTVTSDTETPHTSSVKSADDLCFPDGTQAGQSVREYLCDCDQPTFTAIAGVYGDAVLSKIVMGAPPEMQEMLSCRIENMALQSQSSCSMAFDGLEGAKTIAAR